MSVCLRQSISIASWNMDCELLFNLNVSDSSIAFTLEKKKGHPYHILLFCSDFLEMQILLFLFSSLCFSTFYPSFQAPPPASYKSQFLIGGYALGFSKLGQWFHSWTSKLIWSMTSDNQSLVIRKDSLGATIFTTAWKARSI